MKRKAASVGYPANFGFTLKQDGKSIRLKMNDGNECKFTIGGGFVQKQGPNNVEADFRTAIKGE